VLEVSYFICFNNNNNDLFFNMVKTYAQPYKHGTSIYNKQSVMQNSSDTAHTLSCRTATTTGFGTGR